MKSIVILMLLLSSLSFSKDKISLNSRLTDLSLAQNEDVRSLVIDFIVIGQFRTGYPYSPINVNEENIQSFTECIDRDFTPMYLTYGYDTQIGILFIGCAYKLYWL